MVSYISFAKDRIFSNGVSHEQVVNLRCVVILVMEIGKGLNMVPKEGLLEEFVLQGKFEASGRIGVILSTPSFSWVKGEEIVNHSG